MNRYITEIEKKLLLYPRRTSLQVPESYIGGGQSKLKYLGLRVPHLQKSLKEGFSFSAMSQNEQALVWDYVWNNSDCYEVMSLPLSWFYDSAQKIILKKHWSLLKKWSSRIDNWAHSDTLSGIYARILEDEPKRVYATLAGWNRSKNPWLRRLSLVSLLYYAPQRKKVLPLKQILPLIQAQLDDEHYYVQKGVGWTLREVGRVYPKETYAFLEKNILKLSSVAFGAATERITPHQKQRLKKMR